jgi:RNA polymerase sigma-70 factor, ECF subfamily
MEITFAEVIEPVLVASPRSDADSITSGLYRDRGPELWAFGRRLGLDPDECDDAVQEAHLRLWSALSGGAALDDPVAWLFRVFYRLAMDRHRLSRRVREYLRSRSREPSAGSQSDRSLELSVWAAVDDLPVRQRAALYLHYRADLSFERVAGVMGVTPGAARTHASRGVATIRRRLAGLTKETDDGS